MAPQPAPKVAVSKIEVRLKLTRHRMAGSDDPVFLELQGPSGREFRLRFAQGKSLRRGAEDVYVLGPPDAADTNIAHPELNDPTRPPLDLAGIQGVRLYKSMEPIPNVRGMGEMDDRLELEEIEVTIHGGDATARGFHRAGPIWLGLVSGLSVSLTEVDAPA